MITVSKGGQTTTITEKQLTLYKSYGWEAVANKAAAPTAYDEYTKAQLVEIGANSGILLNARLTRAEMISRLKQEPSPSAPTNEGFSDNLIKGE